MPFRVSGHDLATGRPCAPYESRASSEADAHAEAVRLGVRISALEPIASLAARDQADHVALGDWSWPRLDWRTTRWALIRLGLEHPRWGKVLATTASVSAIVARTRIVPVLIATTLGAGLAAAGIRGDPRLLGVIAMVATLLLPIFVAKPLVYRHLRRIHAAGGFDRKRRLRVDDGATHWFDGEHERRLGDGDVAEIVELRHSILIRLRHGSEIAIPLPCFGSPALARHFAERLAAMHEVKLRTSPWSAPKRGDSALETALVWIAFALLAVVGIIVLLAFGLALLGLLA